MRLSEKVVELLKSQPEQRFTAREIANWIFETYPEECREKQERSRALKTPLDTDEALIQQIVAEIGAQRPGIESKNLNIQTIEERPRKYVYLIDPDDFIEDDPAEYSDAKPVELKMEPLYERSTIRKSVRIKPGESEHDLYPKLAEYVALDKSVRTLRIDEGRSSNLRGRNGNKWLHPDLVGLEVRSLTWDQETKDCVTLYGDKKTIIWSFEVKRHLSKSNVRESFFQTVSNSSWSNFGYLVAAEIDTKVIEELQVLSSRHGIGLIKLNSENPPESQILIPAEEKSDVDWDSVDRLVKENPDFKKFVKLIRQFYQTSELRKSDWISVSELE